MAPSSLPQKLSAQVIILLLISSVVLLPYTNCAQIGAWQAATTMDLPLEHPELPAQQLYATEKRPLFAEKEYVADLIRDVFVLDNLQNESAIESILDTWVNTKGNYFGAGCNIYDTYSNRACGTVALNQAGSAQTTKQSEQLSATVVRESFKIAVCERVLGDDVGLQAALEKIPGSEEDINSNTVRAAYDLFYRGLPSSQQTIAQLLLTNEELIQANIPAHERWRMLLLLICESPGWQVL